MDIINKNQITVKDEDISFEIRKTKALINVYKNRLKPIKPFKKKTISTLYNLFDPKEKSKFFSKLKNKGGTYVFKYKEDHLVYYFGQTNNFLPPGDKKI